MVSIYITQPLKNNKVLPFEAAWMDLENIILSEVSQREKDQYYMISPLRGVKKKKTIQKGLYRKQKQTHRYRKQMYAYQRRKGVG